jgi:excisionase family DNA binding protein
LLPFCSKFNPGDLGGVAVTELLTRDETARLLRVCTRSVDKLIRSGQLGYVKIGRRVMIPARSVEQLAARPAA